MPRTLAQHFDPKIGPKRILSLSGGGVRGLITLGVLERLETLLQNEQGPDSRLCDHYDLIAGTSTGSIIAVALALGWRVADMRDLYNKVCPVLFRPNRRLGIFRPKFDGRYLDKILSAHLVEEDGSPMPLGTKSLRTGLLVCAKRMDTDSAWFLTNNPKAKYYDAAPGQNWLPNKHYLLKDIIRASTAAPGYLSPVSITISDGRYGYAPETGIFVDGAMCGFNYPAPAALQVATLPSYGFDWPIGESNLSILSLGTGRFRDRKDLKAFSKARPFQQAAGALLGMINDSDNNGLTLMQSLSEARRPIQLNTEIGGLSGEHMTPEPLFKFQHIDISLETDTLRALPKINALPDQDVINIRNNLRRITDGRTENLNWCRYLGECLAKQVSQDDLFL